MRLTPALRAARKTVSAARPSTITRDHTLDKRLAKARRKGDSPLDDQLAKARRRGDPWRVDIVDSALCDDIISYLGPSLQNYKHCDIIDGNPGAGLWSSKIHDLLQPRRHVLLEPDEKYTPFLKPLLEQPESRYIHVPYDTSSPQSLVDVLQNGLLPEQTLLEHGDPRLNQLNTSLLVLLNLSRRALSTTRGAYFLNRHMIHNFHTNAWTHTGIHRYGQVRVLVWVEDTIKDRLMPKCIGGDSYSLAFQQQTDTAIVAESYRAKVPRQGTDLDLASAVRVVEKMRRINLELPPHRSNPTYQAALSVAAVQSKNGKSDDVHSLIRSRFVSPLGAIKEMQQLEADFQAGLFTTPTGKGKYDHRWDRMMELKSFHEHSLNYRDNNFKAIEPVLVLAEKAIALELIIASEDRSAAERLAAKEEWEKFKTDLNKTVARMASNRQSVYLLTRDNRKALYRDSPLLMWDRRPFEPLHVDKGEFHRPVPLALLDITPKPAPRKYSHQDLKYWQRFVDRLTNRTKIPVNKALDNLWPGAADVIIPQLGAIRDVHRGGSLDIEEMMVRMLTPEMMDEIVDAWRNWTFRPEALEDKFTTDRMDWDDLVHIDSSTIRVEF